MMGLLLDRVAPSIVESLLALAGRLRERFRAWVERHIVAEYPYDGDL